jgi:hypothetical protein
MGIPGTDATRPYMHGSEAYHEAGHAVAFLYYGIEIDCVAMRRNDSSANRAETRLVPRGEITGITALENEMRCTAAGDIAWRRVGNFAVTEDRFLLAGFRDGAAWVRDNPGETNPPSDDAIFARYALARDEEIRQADPEAPIGPDSWLRIWREAEQLIGTELWSAVRAVAEELRRSETGLTGAEIAAVAETAMKAG